MNFAQKRQHKTASPVPLSTSTLTKPSYLLTNLLALLS